MMYNDVTIGMLSCPCVVWIGEWWLSHLEVEWVLSGSTFESMNGGQTNEWWLTGCWLSCWVFEGVIECFGESLSSEWVTKCWMSPICMGVYLYTLHSSLFNWDITIIIPPVWLTFWLVQPRTQTTGCPGWTGQTAASFLLPGTEHHNIIYLVVSSHLHLTTAHTTQC